MTTRSSNPAIYLIRSTSEVDVDGDPLWWSTEADWATLGEAVVFTPEEAEKARSVRLPADSELVCFKPERRFPTKN